MDERVQRTGTGAERSSNELTGSGRSAVRILHETEQATVGVENKVAQLGRDVRPHGLRPRGIGRNAPVRRRRNSQFKFIARRLEGGHAVNLAAVARRSAVSAIL